jgi:hypothetical protein
MNSKEIVFDDELPLRGEGPLLSLITKSLDEQAQERLRSLSRAVADGRLVVGPTLSELALSQWERNVGVRLPAEYRRFLLEVGDGGSGPPQHGLWPLRQRDLADIDDGDFSFARDSELLLALSQPFPLTAAWRVVDDDFDAGDNILRSGNLLLGTDGCDQFWHLITAGWSRGQVWSSESHRIECRAPDFLSWYASWARV